MNIGRRLLRRGSLIVATLAMVMTGTVVVAPAPASAGATGTPFCNLTAPYPRVNTAGTLVTAEAYVNCFGGGPTIVSLWLDLIRDGAVVQSAATGGAAIVTTSCVPGNYVATARAYITYPHGTIPPSDYIPYTSPSVYISCVATPVVANPGNQRTYVTDYASLQMTATGGAPPYTWSATGLPPGLSINPNTGLIGGYVTSMGTTTVVVTATDTAGRSGRAQFSWNVRREACPTC
jgi:hypothetical protein